MFQNSLSSEESELSDSLTNCVKAIRVSVCLKRYFEDVRSRCYMQVVKNRRVRWLEKRIQKIFSLPGNFCLCSNGHLLPSSEPLALLRREDAIEVIPLHEVHERSSVLNVNKVQGRHMQSNERVSNSLKMLSHGSHSASVAINQETMSNEADKSTLSIHPEEYTGPSKIISSTEINGARTSYETPHPADSSPRVDNENFTSPSNKNEYHETTDASYTLQQLKRRALDLLDAQLGAGDTVDAAAGEPPPQRRARRRVRRRVRRRTPGPDPGPEPRPDPESEKDSERGLEPGPEPEPCSSVYAGSHSESESTSVAPEVARNESARTRPPRVVSSLQADD